MLEIATEFLRLYYRNQYWDVSESTEVDFSYVVFDFQTTLVGFVQVNVVQ